MGGIFKSLDPDDDVLSIGLNRAVALLADAKPKGRGLGEHPQGGGAVEVRRGRFGPFVLHGSRVASLPRNMDFDAVTLEEAVKLLADKGKELKPKGGRGAKGAAPARRGATSRAAAAPANGEAAAAPKKKAAPKAVEKAATAKKPAAKKTAPKPAAASARRSAVSTRKAAGG
jgi:DNA topoisomerase-1